MAGFYGGFIRASYSCGEFKYPQLLSTNLYKKLHPKIFHHQVQTCGWYFMSDHNKNHTEKVNYKTY